MRNRRGFALMAALWLVVLIGITGYELSVRSRVRRLAIANTLEEGPARAAADAAVETIESDLAFRLAHVPTNPLGDPWSIDSSRYRDTLHLGDERARVNVEDAGAKLQLNRASEDDIRRLLVALRVDAREADHLAQCIMDWRDADDLRRASGAERDEYVKARARVLPANADFAAVGDLKNVAGVTPDLYARVAGYVTVYGSGQVNVNAAPRVVLQSLPGLTEETIDVLLAARSSSRPLRSLDELSQRVTSGSRAALADAGAELASRAVFDTREILVDADGWLAGSPMHAHVVALAQRNGDAVTIAWRRRVDE